MLRVNVGTARDEVCPVRSATGHRRVDADRARNVTLSVTPHRNSQAVLLSDFRLPYLLLKLENCCGSQPRSANASSTSS